MVSPLLQRQRLFYMRAPRRSTAEFKREPATGDNRPLFPSGAAIVASHKAKARREGRRAVVVLLLNLYVTAEAVTYKAEEGRWCWAEADFNDGVNVEMDAAASLTGRQSWALQSRCRPVR